MILKGRHEYGTAIAIRIWICSQSLLKCWEVTHVVSRSTLHLRHAFFYCMLPPLVRKFKNQHEVQIQLCPRTNISFDELSLRLRLEKSRMQIKSRYSAAMMTSVLRFHKRSSLSCFSLFYIFAVHFSESSHSNLLPTIDISLCDKVNAYHLRSSCYHEIDAALREYGTFVAVGHGIQPYYFAESFSNADELFSLEIDSKLNVSMSHHKDDFGRGYIPFGQEAGVSSYFEIKEGYSYGLPRKQLSDLNTKRNPMESLNIWPESLRVSTKDALESVFTEKVRVAKIIIEAIVAVQAELDEVHGTQNDLVAALTTTLTNEDKVDNSINRSVKVSSDGDSISLLRLFHYFSSESESESESEAEAEWKRNKNMKSKVEGENNSDGKSQMNRTNIMKVENKTYIGSSPHTDWGLLTVIMQDEVGGLQFLYNNKWNDIPMIKHGLIINGGDYLHLISNGKYHSPIHRVLCPPKGRERTSFVFFYYPGFYSKIKRTKNGDVQIQMNTQPEQEIVHGGYNTFVKLKIKNDNNDDIINDKNGRMNNENENEYSTFGDYILQKWRGVTIAIS